MNNLRQDSEVRDWTVGKGRPPKHRQWQKGESGNPKGRRPRVSNVDECVAALLAQHVTLEIDGAPQTVTFGEAVARKMVQQALKGMGRAQRDVIAAQQRHEQKSVLERDVVIEAELVFDNEEDRLVSMARELKEKNAEIQRLTQLIPFSTS